MSCVSTVTSRAVVSQSRHLSIEICPPFDLAAAVHGNLVDVDVLYTSSILLHRFFSSMHFDAAWSFDAASGYKYVGRRAYLLINQ